MQALLPDEEEDEEEVIAAEGLAGPGQGLPHLEAIQEAFGDHDVSGVDAHIGGPAAEASEELGAEGFAKGSSVGFAGQPTLRLAAHEAAHAEVGDGGSAMADGGLGGDGAQEQHADAVADAVVSGQSAAPLLDGAAAGGGGASPGGGPVHLWEQPGPWDRMAEAKGLLKQLKRGQYNEYDGSLLNNHLRWLSMDSSKRGQRLFRKLKRAARRTNFYLKNVSAFINAKQVLDAHKSGTDAGTIDRASINKIHLDARKATLEAAHAGDPRLEKLDKATEHLAKFYIPVEGWGKDIDKHDSYLRQLTTFLDAQVPLDANQLLEVRTQVPIWRQGVVEPFLDDPLVNNSKIFKKFSKGLTDFVALEARLKAMEAQGLDATGRDVTKSGWRARKEEVPAYREVDPATTQRDFKLAQADAEKVLADPEAWPGDIKTVLLRLKSIQPKVQPQKTAEEVIPPLITRLEAKFAGTGDPEFLKENRGVSVDFDLDKPINMARLETVLRMIADEPGELGKIRFKLTIRGEWGNWLAKVYAQGWAQFEVFYGVSDAMACFMGFDVSAAVGAGISLAGGLVEAGVEVGKGFGMKARFHNPSHAAQWLYNQFADVNDRCYEESKGHVTLFNLSGSRALTPSPTVVAENRSFAGASVKVDAGVAGVSASTQKEFIDSRYEKDGNVVHGKSTRRTTTYSGFIKVGGLLVTLAYNKTNTVTEREINTANEDDEVSNAFSLEFDVSKELQRTLGKDLDPKDARDKVFKILSSGLDKFKKVLPGGKLSAKVMDKLVVGVAEKVFDASNHARKFNMGLALEIDLEWASVKEKGHYRHMYMRAGVTPKLKASIELDAPMIDIKGEMEASKREVIYESIGAKTYDYVFNRYMFAWDKKQWETFVLQHRPQIEELIKNMGVRRGANAYDSAFAKRLKAAGYPGGSFTQHVAALEAHWETQRSTVMRKGDS
ncbi:MAG: hypothetical protein JRI25_16400 [Deltaproteobacteria bacterium]|nr:hypothetical protein [Deltaproteobacteria bacterium]